MWAYGLIYCAGFGTRGRPSLEGMAMWQKVKRAILAGLVTSVVLVPASAGAQVSAGAIAGTVRDATGGVLPGVTIEASSPALIEKVRTTVTDNEGQYRIVDLRPGLYAV